MNLILLFAGDFVDDHTVRLTGRRLTHVTAVHRATVGDELVVGIEGGGIGRGEVTRLEAEALEMRVVIDREPPKPLDVTLVRALPRPKVLNRVIAGATSMGVKRIYLINAWRVEKSYWKSPKLAEGNLRLQRVLGLEQARDTILPSIELRRFFRPFVEDELPAIIEGTKALVAHPYVGAGRQSCLPGQAGSPVVHQHVTFAIGPEGGFIQEEIASLERIGFQQVSLGERILRVETAVAVALAATMRAAS
jgi:16S rRNA (uracil1498-N3)-methyltransferase